MMGLILGVVAIILALISLFDKKTSWEFQDRVNRNRGITDSKPTNEWHDSMNVTGIVLIIFGVILISVGIVNLT